MANPSRVEWRKSSCSGPRACLELALVANHVVIRDVKDRTAPVLEFTAIAWEMSSPDVQGDEFDLSRKGEQRVAAA